MVAVMPTLILSPFRAKRPHSRRRVYIMNHRMKSSSVLRIALSRDEGPKELIQHHLSVEAHQKPTFRTSPRGYLGIPAGWLNHSL